MIKYKYFSGIDGPFISYVTQKTWFVYTATPSSRVTYFMKGSLHSKDTLGLSFLYFPSLYV